jgi:hypothetical protein
MQAVPKLVNTKAHPIILRRSRSPQDIQYGFIARDDTRS